MNINYTVLNFEPLQKLFVVEYSLENKKQALNLPLPIQNNEYLKGEELDRFIRAFAPTADIELEEKLSGMDASHITALIPTPPPPTPEEEKKALIDGFTFAIEAWFREEALKCRYDSIDRACSYAAVENPFQAESKSFLKWRGEVWATAYQILAEVEKGNREIPTIEKLFTLLPERVIPS